MNIILSYAPGIYKMQHSEVQRPLSRRVRLKVKKQWTRIDSHVRCTS